MGKLQMLGNLLDHWDLMANDTKDTLKELEPGFYSAMEALRNAYPQPTK